MAYPTLYDVMESLWSVRNAVNRVERKIDKVTRKVLDDDEVAELIEELKQSEKDLAAAIEAAKIKT